MPLISPNSELYHDAEPHRVLVRRRWTDPWVLVPGLYCDWLEWGANPKLHSAGLSWRYGEGMLPHETDFSAKTRRDLARWYVQVQIDQPAGEPLRWHGVIDEEGTHPDGAYPRGYSSTSRRPTGRQSLVAYGLEILLQRQTIDCCYWQNGNLINRIGRGLTFNEFDQRYGNFYELDQRRGAAGNCSSARSGAGCYVFGDAQDIATWSTRDICEYLLTFHAPTNAAGLSLIEFEWDQAALLLVPDWDAPVVDLDGRTLKEVLDELLDRRRLLGYTLDVQSSDTPNGDRVILRPFTWLEEPLELEAGTFAANPRQKALDFDAARDIESAVLKRSASQTFDEVIVSGHRVVCCGSIASRDDTLVPHWTDADKTAYDSGGSGETGYPAADAIAARQDWHKRYRNRERMQRVYCLFGLPEDWDGKVGDGLGGAKTDLFPYDALDWPREDPPWYPRTMRFHRHLPLVDLEAAGDRHAVEYRRPAVWVRLHDALITGEHYLDGEKLAQRADLEETGDTTGHRWSLGVRTHDGGPAIELRVSGEEQHVLAKNHFTPANDADDNIAEYDYDDNLLCTVALEADARVQVRWPADLSGVEDEAARRLFVDVSKREHFGHFWWIAAKTATGLDGKHELIQEPAARALRDDRPRMRDLARIAYEWFGKPRQALAFTYKQASPLFAIGDLITTLGGGDYVEPILTVVTEIRMELGQSIDQPHRTTIQTQWAELDLLRFV
jgi:hypothetical protein